MLAVCVCPALGQVARIDPLRALYRASNSLYRLRDR